MDMANASDVSKQFHTLLDETMQEYLKAKSPASDPFMSSFQVLISAVEEQNRILDSRLAQMEIAVEKSRYETKFAKTIAIISVVLSIASTAISAVSFYFLTL